MNMKADRKDRQNDSEKRKKEMAVDLKHEYSEIALRYYFLNKKKNTIQSNLCMTD